MMIDRRAGDMLIALLSRFVDGPEIDRKPACDSDEYLDCQAFPAIEVKRFQSLLVLLHHDKKMSHWSGFGVKTCVLLGGPVLVGSL